MSAVDDYNAREAAADKLRQARRLVKKLNEFNEQVARAERLTEEEKIYRAWCVVRSKDGRSTDREEFQAELRTYFEEHPIPGPDPETEWNV